MSLSQFAILKARAKEKPYKLSDGEGLHLLVQPGGSKLWRFRYRFAGRENMLTPSARIPRPPWPLRGRSEPKPGIFSRRALTLRSKGSWIRSPLLPRLRTPSGL